MRTSHETSYQRLIRITNNTEIPVQGKLTVGTVLALQLPGSTSFSLLPGVAIVNAHGLCGSRLKRTEYTAYLYD
jgi:hypothetical protein